MPTTATTSDEELSGVSIDIKLYVAQAIATTALPRMFHSPSTMAMSSLSRTSQIISAIEHLLSSLIEDMEGHESHRTSLILPEHMEKFPANDGDDEGMQSLILNRRDRRRVLGISPSPLQEDLRLSTSPNPRVRFKFDDCEAETTDAPTPLPNPWRETEDVQHAYEGTHNPPTSMDASGLPNGGALDPDSLSVPESQNIDMGPLSPQPVGDHPMRKAHIPALWRSERTPVRSSRNEESSSPTGLAEFLQLRSQQQKVISFPISPKPLPSRQQSTPTTNAIPVSLLNGNTLAIPTTSTLPSTTHTYLTSLKVIQRSKLVRLLASSVLVNLTERESLSGVDLILSPHDAVILIPSFSLPLDHRNLADQLSTIGLRFARILLLVECYPLSTSLKEDRLTVPTLNAFSPPFVKAVQNLRRTLAIMASCDVRLTLTEFSFSFATSLEETALLIRSFGDAAERKDTTEGLIWQDRSWLVNDEYEEVRSWKFEGPSLT
jgi:hypothetical protein